MAKGTNKQRTAVNRVTEAVGHALGSVVNTIETFQEQHPHPMDDAREALATGQEALSAAASSAGTRATTIIKKAKAVARQTKKAVARQTKKVVTRVAPKRKPAARVARTARKVVKRATKAVNRAGKAVKAAGRRLKR